MVDEDRSGTIDFREFLLMMSKKISEKTIIDELVDVFKLFDPNGDACLGRGELKEMMALTSGKEASKVNSYVYNMMEEMDESGEGSLDVSQFVYRLLS